MADFAHDIRPLFREHDIESMRWAFDLGKYEDVKARAEAIYNQLSAGTMPCDGAWPPNHLVLFRQWIDQGCAP